MRYVGRLTIKERIWIAIHYVIENVQANPDWRWYVHPIELCKGFLIGFNAPKGTDYAASKT
jgi:hypothetical protein